MYSKYIIYIYLFLCLYKYKYLGYIFAIFIPGHKIIIISIFLALLFNKFYILFTEFLLIYLQKLIKMLPTQF